MCKEFNTSACSFGVPNSEVSKSSFGGIEREIFKSDVKIGNRKSELVSFSN